MAGTIPNQEVGRVQSARSWLRRARLDYKGFAKLVGPQFVQLGKNRPDDPALSVYLLQQSVEKALKAVAVASGRFRENQLRQDYGHRSLELYLDLLTMILDTSFAGMVAMMPGFTSSSTDCTRDKVARIKRNIGRSPAGETPDWWRGYANLTPDDVFQTTNMLVAVRGKLIGTLHKAVKGRSRIPMAKIERYVNSATPENLKEMLSPVFRGQIPSEANIELTRQLFKKGTGAEFHEILRGAFDQGGGRSAMLGEMRREQLDQVILSAWALGGLLWLAALTFPHESSTRYPDYDQLGKRTGLNCESYDDSLGVVRHLWSVARLAELVLNDMEPCLESIGFSLSGSTPSSGFYSPR